jgi:hypothetical protein
MTEPTITCPKCRTEIPLTESLAAPLIEATKDQYERLLVEKNNEIMARAAALRAREVSLSKEKANLDQQLTEKLATERKRISAEELAKAKRLVSADLDEKTNEVAELQSVLKQRDKKLAEAQQAQVELIRKQRELDDAKREMDVTIEKQVQAALSSVREKAKQEVEERLKLRVLEKEEQIASMQRQIEELKRKSEQGSQQLQGEVQELELEAMLRSRFPRDMIEPVPKGEFGGDALQHVFSPGNQDCGTILWESKRTKNWGNDWLPKLREDQRRSKTDVAVIVTNTLPKGVHTFDHVDGIWVAEFRFAVPVAIALRQSLIEIAAARKADEGQQTKSEMVYRYLTGPQFRQRVEAIVEKFSEMQNDLEKERKAMTRLWAKREFQIRGVIEATAGMVGDLQGIAGNALEEIQGIQLPMLESSVEDSEL